MFSPVSRMFQNDDGSLFTTRYQRNETNTVSMTMTRAMLSHGATAVYCSNIVRWDDPNYHTSSLSLRVRTVDIRLLDDFSIHWVLVNFFRSYLKSKVFRTGLHIFMSWEPVFMKTFQQCRQTYCIEWWKMCERELKSVLKIKESIRPE